MGKDPTITPYLEAIMLKNKSEKRSSEDIAHHYDLSNEFYQLFLDEHMQYSCAYFEHLAPLDVAQRNKMELICQKLDLKSGEKLLDIGCGWGGLMIWAAKNYGVSVHGITLSQQQYDHATKWIREEGLGDKCTVSMTDYRNLSGIYDKVVSIEMLEQVGNKKLAGYFKKIKSVLAPEGAFLVPMTTVSSQRGKSSPEYKFMEKYIFPGGELETISKIQNRIEEVGFEILNVDNLRPHYMTTLRCWAERLAQNRDKAIKLVGEKKYRAWLMYLAGCSHAHKRGDSSVFQVSAGQMKRVSINNFEDTPDYSQEFSEKISVRGN